MIRTWPWHLRQALLGLLAPALAFLPGAWGNLMLLPGLHLAGLAFQTRREWSRSPRHRLVNGLTLTRPVLIGLTVIAGSGLDGYGLAILFWIAALLDAADGYLARRLGVVTRTGGILDEESDAFFMLALGLVLWQGDWLPGWIVVPGWLRYAVLWLRLRRYGDAAPALRIPGARQIGGWSFALAPSLFLWPAPWRTVVAALLSLALCYSFTMEIRHYVRD